MPENSAEKFIVVIFYKYVVLEIPEIIRNQVFELAEKFGLKGRILIGKEGINATAAGSVEGMQKFVEEVSKIKGFEDIDFKYGDCDFIPFPKLKVKVREEIVTLGPDAKNIDMSKAEPANHITPEQLEEFYNEDEENLVVIDARNEYEYRIGKFRNSITADIENFRELPTKLKEIKDKVKGKKVVFTCTSGVRCEKLTAYAKSIGYEGEIYQLNGGMQRYLEKFPASNFEGSLYVFDDRISVAYDKSENRKIISECEFCHKPSDSMKNCYNAKCNKRMIACDECFKENEGCCSSECKQIKYPRKVKYRFEDVLKG